jgi:hypothetical protein
MYLAYTAWQLVIGAVGAAVPPVASEPQLSCGNVGLASASGVIGPKHHYSFSAHCSYESQDPWRKDPPSPGSCGKVTITASLQKPGTGSRDPDEARGVPACPKGHAGGS